MSSIFPISLCRVGSYCFNWLIVIALHGFTLCVLDSVFCAFQLWRVQSSALTFTVLGAGIEV